MEITIRSSEILHLIPGVLSSGISTGEKSSGFGLPSRAQRVWLRVERVAVSDAHAVLNADSRKGRKGYTHDIRRPAAGGHGRAATVVGIALLLW